MLDSPPTKYVRSIESEHRIRAVRRTYRSRKYCTRAWKHGNLHTNQHYIDIAQDQSRAVTSNGHSKLITQANQSYKLINHGSMRSETHQLVMSNLLYSDLVLERQLQSESMAP